MPSENLTAQNLSAQNLSAQNLSARNLSARNLTAQHMGAANAATPPGVDVTPESHPTLGETDVEDTVSTRSGAQLDGAPLARASNRLVAQVGISLAGLVLLVSGVALVSGRMTLEQEHGLDFGISKLQDGLHARGLAPVPVSVPSRRTEQVSRRDLPDDPLSRRVRRIWRREDGTAAAFTASIDPQVAQTENERGCRYADVTTCIARCEAGHAPSCHRFAEDALYGPGERRNTDRGVDLLVQLCSGGSVPSCALLGTWLESLRPPADPDGPALAESLWEHLCEERVGLGCLRRARLIESRGEHGDRRLLLAALEQGCRLGEAAACLDAARWLLQTRGPEATEQGTKLRESARLMATLGCSVSKRTEDCLTLARAAREASDAAAARTHLAQAREVLTGPCEAGDPEACFVLGTTFVVSGEVAARAVPSFEQACIAGVARACFVVADLFTDGTGGIPASAVRASQLHERGCRLGEGRSCLAVARLLERQGIEPETVDRYRSVGAVLGARSLDALHMGEHLR